ncbi:arabinose metabolism transcriptional repressor AraR [Thermoclostridium stercorarium subsp. thermolacticum DSM 2910]|uniref:Arabinose metabolism transcriptional repressor AraR n=1 Tax=Thermoclostridium stercorarium subsp. thermolacticum DSM 2910 TaxID=1121336 RepID=A0A1B1YDW8_THEST|nr:GntR family transcriptional regulator [Thermoclostridium stercorarium]ANW98948.1 arabinose metabolism transcriptional repressor AraR [Thermoclostridium stercorarium subsp. thermolacticum DSM 2910]
MEQDKPKYLQLKEYLIGLIENNELPRGNKIPSENELAEKFHISRHTVRRAISELVNEGVLITSQGKGTFVNNEPKSRQNLIGVITTYIGDYIFPSIIRGIDQVLSENGYSIALGCTNNQFDKERQCLENFMKQDIKGLIVETTKSALPNPNIELYDEFRKRNIPVLFMHGSYKGYSASSIYEDDVEAGYIATKHLIELGHRKIAGIFKIDDIQGHARFEGYCRAHRESGIDINDKRIIWFGTDDMLYKFGKQSGDMVIEFLEDSTSLVCYNEQISIKVIDIIREKGLTIPERLSLVSFDDSELAVASEVKMTTVAHPKEKLGIEAANLMLKMIKEGDGIFKVKMTPELVVRNSTGRVNG